MPVPRNALNPREYFGFGRLPVSDYFNLPAGAAANPAFSPAARNAFAGEQAFIRDRQNAEREMALEDQANELLDTAASRSDEGLQDDLLANPRLLGTPQAKTIQEWMAARQQAQQPKPQSDLVLGPLFAEKIEDPGLRSQFQERMSSGLSFEEARDSYYDELNDRNQMVKLAEAGIPEEEFEFLRDGRRLSPIAVARRISDEKRRRSTTSNELDKQIDLLEGAVRARSSVLTKQGVDLAADPSLNQWTQQLADLYPRRLGQLAGGTPGVVQQPLDASGLPVLPATIVPQTPPVAGTPPPPVAAPGVAPQITPGQQAFQDVLTPQEARERYEAQQRESQAVGKEQEGINKAWTQAKLDVGKQLLEKYPNKDAPYGNEAELLARSILSDKVVTINPGTEFEANVPFWTQVLDSDVRFEEPGNQRFGSQTVSQEEVLKAWARDFLEAKGLLQTGEAPVEEIQLSAEDQALLDKYSPKP